MKNPLVDALRQASEQFKVSDAPPPAARPAQLESPPAEELRLFDTLAIDPAAKTANDELDADFYSATALAAADGDDDMQIVRDGPTGRERSRTLAGKSGGSGLPRFGRYSPWLCLALLVITSSLYFTYQYLGGRFVNVDLQVLSTQLDPDSGDAAAGAGARFVNPLQLIRSPAASNSAVSAERATIVAAGVPAAATVPAAKIAAAAAPDRAFAALNDAYRAFEAGDLVRAEAAYREALRLAPRHPNALHGLAAVLQQSGRTAESIPLYSTLLSVDPHNTAAIVALLLEQGDQPAAVHEIKFLLQEHADSAALNFALGTVLAGQSRWVDAGYYFGRAVQLEADNADYLFNYALSLERQGKLAAARREYESALQASGSSSVVREATLLARIEQLGAGTSARGARQ